MPEKRDYYDILGVSKRATDEQLKIAFRKKALEYHPDRNKSKDAEAKFKEINEAYQILSDSEKRAKYDQIGHAGVTGPAGSEGFEGFGGFGDIFDSFFADFDSTTNDYYDLKRIDPGYRVYFGEQDYFDLVENLDDLKSAFNKLEEGGGRALNRYLEDAGEKYEVAVKKFMYKPSLSPLEYIHLDLIKRLGRLNLFKPISKHIRQHFTNPKIIQMTIKGYNYYGIL